MVGVEHGARLGDLQVVLGAHVPRHVDQPVEVGPDPAVLGRLLGHPFQAAQFLLRLLQDVGGHAGVGDLLAVLADDVLLAVLAELLADRAHLLAQQELALALLHAFADVGADLVLQLQVGQRVLGPAHDELEAGLDLDRLQDLDLLLEGQVGRVAGGVGDLAGVGDPPEELGHLRHAARLHDVLDHGAVLASELLGAGGGLGLLDGLGLDPQGLAGAGHADAHDGTREPADHQGLDPAPGLAEVFDLGDRADARVATVHLGDQQHRALGGIARGLGGGASFVGFQGQGDDHAGQDDPGGEGQQGQDVDVDVGHIGASFSGDQVGSTRVPPARTVARPEPIPIG